MYRVPTGWRTDLSNSARPEPYTQSKEGFDFSGVRRVT